MQQIVFKNKDFYIGLIYSFTLIISTFNPRISLPLILFGSILYFSKKHISRDYIQLAYLLIAKIIFMTLIFLLFKFQYGPSFLFQQVATDLILLVLLFFKPPANFLNGFIFGIIVLFFINLLFNLILVLNGSDPFGRTIYIRYGESIPRLTGFYGHPYYSSYISFLGLLIGSLKKNKMIILISSISCIFTGSFRSWTLFISFLTAYFSLKILTKNKVIFIMIFSAIICLSLNIFYQPEGSANYLRVFAWQNSIQKIIENPIFGNHDFANYKFDGDIDGINSDRILELGISENTFLQFMQDFGLLAGILHFLIYAKILMIILNRFYKNPNNHFNLLQAIFICVGFSDNFYGGLMANMFVSTFFSVIALHSFEKMKMNTKLINYSKMDTNNFI